MPRAAWTFRSSGSRAWPAGSIARPHSWRSGPRAPDRLRPSAGRPSGSRSAPGARAASPRRRIRRSYDRVRTGRAVASKAAGAHHVNGSRLSSSGYSQGGRTMWDSTSGGGKRALRDAIARKKDEVRALEGQRDSAESELRRLEAELETLDGPLPGTRDVSAGSDNSVVATAAEKIALFRSLFRGRDDVFPVLWTNARTGRTGYAPACGNEWKQGVCEKPRIRCGACPNQAFLPIRDRVILDHLQGRHVVGVYPLLGDETCRFLAADFDKGDWMQHVAAFRDACRAVELPVAVERSRSGDGAHAWFFFDAPVSAAAAAGWAAICLPERCRYTTGSTCPPTTGCFRTRTRCLEAASATSLRCHCNASRAQGQQRIRRRRLPPRSRSMVVPRRHPTHSALCSRAGRGAGSAKRSGTRGPRERGGRGRQCGALASHAVAPCALSGASRRGADP